MADTINPVMSVIATTASKLSDLEIKNGQLIFSKDTTTIALDLNGKRTFYNQITLLETDEERKDLLAPVNKSFYFIVSTAVLWTYIDRWIPITTPPEEIVFIGVDLPVLGSERTLYVDKEKKCISVWDDSKQEYVIVADTTEEMTTDEILLLFA